MFFQLDDDNDIKESITSYLPVKDRRNLRLTSQQNAAAATELHQTHPLLWCLHSVARQQHPDAFSKSVDAALNRIVGAAMNAVGPTMNATHKVEAYTVAYDDVNAEPVTVAEGYGGRWDEWANWQWRSHKYEYYDGIAITIASSSINESHQMRIANVMRLVLQRENAMADDKNMRYEFQFSKPVYIYRPINMVGGMEWYT